jgi:hypothetical protein
MLTGMDKHPHLYIFQSVKNPTLYAFTVEPDGGNLPGERGDWTNNGTPIPLNTTLESTSPAISKQIKRDGYALVEGADILAGRSS